MLQTKGTKLIVSLPHSRKLVFVDEDSTVPLLSLPLSFPEHFYPQSALTLIPSLQK